MSEIKNRVTIEIDAVKVQAAVDQAVEGLKGRLGVFGELLDERKRQDEQWGGAAVDDTRYSYQFMDYITRQQQKVATDYVSANKGVMTDRDAEALYRARFVKIAALAVAAIESIDRKAKA